MNEDHLDLNKVMKSRREKLTRLREAGIESFAYSYSRSHLAEQILNGFAELEGQTVSLAGRLMSLRSMGKVTFCHIMDASA